MWRRTVAVTGAGVALTTLAVSGASVVPARAAHRLSVHHASAQVSGNWAGYIDTADDVTAVAGSWVVPQAGSLPPGVSSAWVGIGGATTGDLIQAGTQQASTPFASFLAGGAYGAWYELLPANPVFITGCAGDPNCTVNPGDTMRVTVAELSPDVFEILMSDVGHWNYGAVLPYQSSHSSAEWIFESPSLFGALPVPVGGSGTVTFGGANGVAVHGSGHFQSIGSGSNPAIALPLETAVSGLGRDGNSFNVCTYAFSCPAP